MRDIRISRGCTQAEVRLVQFPRNPYMTILGEEAWSALDRESRVEEIRRRIGSRHPSLGKVSFKFSIKGLPRHQFAQHVRARIGVSFNYSDPETTPTHFIPYTPVYDRIFRGTSIGSHDGGGYEEAPSSVRVRTRADDLTSLVPEEIELEADRFVSATEAGFKILHQLLLIPEGAWKATRDYLPLSYEQPYSFEITLPALMGQCARRLCLGEEAQIVTNHYLQKASVAERFPMLASSLVPACAHSGSCLYAKHYTLSNAFGCLFSGCDYRHPRGTNYASFNESCSDIHTLRREVHPVGVIEEMDRLSLPGSYGALSEMDKSLFVEGS